jgi:phosphoserine phosphatase RsbU/P
MKKKILVINDSESLSEIIQFYLELNHYDVFLASDGYQGIEKAKQLLPDLILLDVVMPGIDGFEVCRLLKQDSTTQEIPVLFLSSLSNTNDKIKGLESGGVDFINNTADQPEVLARIETHLKIRELTQKLQTSNQELRLKQKALNEDLYAAASIQQSLLPPSNLALPDNVSMAWTCQSSELVGGDICNIISFDNQYIIAYILDVSGHGVPSAMVTVAVTQYLQQKQFLNHLFSPKKTLSDLNREYPFEKFNMFSTIFYMLLNTQNGKLTYSNAGHPPAIYLSPKGKFRLLDTTGPMIGIDSQSTFEEKEEILQPGDKVILYTDGVTEFRNDQGEFYGSERLYALLEQCKSCSLDEIIGSISQSLKEFGNGQAPRDDISILGVEFKSNLKRIDER